MTNASFSEQLNNLSSFLPKEKPKQIMAKTRTSPRFLPNPSVWHEDGGDHINISPVGRTDLGRTLHPNSMLPFTHDVFGHFASISSFWDFMEIGAKDDRIRAMGTAERMTYLKRVKKVKVDYLMFFVLDAIWQRVVSYAKLTEHVQSSELPFDIYYFNGEFNYPTRRNGMIWMIRGFEAIRTALQTQQEPDFAGLMDGKTREQLFTHYLDTHVRNRAPVANPENRSERNDLLKELQSSSEAPKAFRRRIRPIVLANRKDTAEVDLSPSEAPVAERLIIGIATPGVSNVATSEDRQFDEPEVDFLGIVSTAPVVESTPTETAEVVLPVLEDIPKSEVLPVPEAAEDK